MNLSGCSKRRVGVLSRTLSLKNRSTPLESSPPKHSKIQICNIIMSKIAANWYNKNSSLYKYLCLLATCSPLHLLPWQLDESGAAPNSDAPCAVVSLASTSLDGQTELRLDWVRFNCCSPTASASAAVPRYCVCFSCCSRVRPRVIAHTQYKV